MAGKASIFLEQLLNGESLDEASAERLMGLLSDGELEPAAAGALLAALRAKGETAAEVRGFVRALRARAKAVRLPAGLGAADSAGTGGDGSGSLNLSTGTALLAAACGLPIIKHGNRSVSSKSGSADVLEALGVPLVATAPAALDCLAQCGFAFLFAPYFHPAMKSVAAIRSAMGVRTVFNFLGPLAHPASPPFYLLGAFDLPHARLLAESLSGLPLKRAFIVHGEPGWDEATPCGPFALFDVRPGQVREERRDPLEAGLRRCAPADLEGGDAQHNAAALEAVLAGRDRGPHRDALLLGAGLLQELSGREASLSAGIARAREALEGGQGIAVLQRLRRFAAGGSE